MTTIRTSATTKKKKKAVAKKAPTKKAATKKTATKKTATKKGATKKTTRKAASKPAPSARSRGATAEQYLAKISGPLAPIAARIAALVKERAPDAKLSLKWGQAVWEHGGPIAFLKRSAKHITFGFWRGAQMKDLRGALEGAGNRMRHLKLSPGKQLDDETIRHYIDQAIALNREHGDPTRRR